MEEGVEKLKKMEGKRLKERLTQHSLDAYLYILYYFCYLLAILKASVTQAAAITAFVEATAGMMCFTTP